MDQPRRRLDRRSESGRLEGWNSLEVVFDDPEDVGVDYLRVDLGLPAATCEAYCASIGQTCSNSCTTNRGYPNWGVEAWSTESQCGSYATSGGQVKCNTNLANYSYHNRRKYRCCCG